MPKKGMEIHIKIEIDFFYRFERNGSRQTALIFTLTIFSERDCLSSCQQIKPVFSEWSLIFVDCDKFVCVKN